MRINKSPFGRLGAFDLEFAEFGCHLSSKGLVGWDAKHTLIFRIKLNEFTEK